MGTPGYASDIALSYEAENRQPSLISKYATKHSMHNIDAIQQELLLLRLQKASTDKRIHALRNAIQVLIGVFGPHILEGSGTTPYGFGNSLSGKCLSNTDICRDVLKDSGNWMTFEEVLRVVQTTAPWISSRYVNPGVSVSNALRFLKRRGEVETMTSTNGVVWRSTDRAASLGGTRHECHELPTNEVPLLNNLTTRGVKR